MAYDPLARGLHPVGVRTAEAYDASRQRHLPVEIWYPASDAHAGQDLSDATRDRYQIFSALPESFQDAVRDAEPDAGVHPMIAFSHGFGGHRRQSTFFCTHLASHGYVVAAMDHVGNTILDLMQVLVQAQSGGEPPDRVGLLNASATDRPADVSFVVDQLLDGTTGALAAHIDAKRIGATGHSFGGWTTLAVATGDQRIRAALPLAPAGGASTAPGDPLPQLLDLDRSRDVPTCYLVAERDSVLPLSGMRALFGRTRSTKRMAVLKNADHLHFCDRVEQVHEFMRAILGSVPEALRQFAPQLPPITELCSGEHAYLFTCGLGLAHMDAVLKEDAAAAEFLAGRAVGVLAERGVEVELH